MTRMPSSMVEVCLLDGYDVIGVTTRFQTMDEATIVDTTALGDDFAGSTYEGTRKVSITQEGFFDDNTGSIIDALTNTLASNAAKPLVMGVEGNLTGVRCVGMKSAYVSKYGRTASMGEVHKASAEFANGDPTYGIMSGQIVAPLVLRDAVSGAQTDYADGGAQSTLGGLMVLEMPALVLGGYDNVIVKLQDAATPGTWVDVASATFVASTVAPSSQAVEVAGTIRRYTRIYWTWTGAGTEMSFTALVALFRH